jgi:hypothetical protein
VTKLNALRVASPRSVNGANEIAGRWGRIHTRTTFIEGDLP